MELVSMPILGMLSSHGVSPLDGKLYQRTLPAKAGTPCFAHHL